MRWSRRRRGMSASRIEAARGATATAGVRRVGDDAGRRPAPRFTISAPPKHSMYVELTVTSSSITRSLEAAGDPSPSAGWRGGEGCRAMRGNDCGPAVDRWSTSVRLEAVTATTIAASRAASTIAVHLCDRLAGCGPTIDSDCSIRRDRTMSSCARIVASSTGERRSRRRTLGDRRSALRTGHVVGVARMVVAGGRPCSICRRSDLTRCSSVGPR